MILCAPDCRAWSRSSNTADKDTRATSRASQLDALDWLLRVCRKQHANGRAFIVENPYGSDIWKYSPLSTLENQFPRQRIHQCRFGVCHPVIREPVEKSTAWVANIKMKSTALRCMRNHAHGSLQGTDPKSGLPVTALAAVYPRKLCGALLEDV